MVTHTFLKLGPYPRGMHLITMKVIEQIGTLPASGILHLFIRHTSAALAVNEGADPSVLRDFARVFDYLVPENLPFLEHTVEGPDDMPAHVKSVMTGVSVTIPILDAQLALGKWQGIYLCEFRNHGGVRHVIASVVT